MCDSPRVVKSSITGLISALAVKLGSKTISIQVEVVDTMLDYNLLLGINWFYAMTFVTSMVFHTVQFPHIGRIFTIDQLDFCMSDVTISTANNIPMLGQCPPLY